MHNISMYEKLCGLLPLVRSKHIVIGILPSCGSGLLLQIPTMIVYGTKDKSLGLESVGSLRNMPNSEIMPMEGAGHANYQEKPNEWHRLLYNFLLAVQH